MAEKPKSSGELKRVLGRMDLLAMAIGMMVGSGIMVLVGYGIGYTGRSVNIAFIIAAVLICLMYLPNIVVAGTARLNGGRYTQTALFAGKYFSGVFLILYLGYNVMLAVYAISFGQYFVQLSWFESVNPYLIAGIILTLFYGLNIIGVKEAAKVQTMMMIILISALLLFVFKGVPEINPGYFTGEGFFTNGFSGLMSAGALLTFALAGGDVVLQLSGEAKNPTKDIPFVLIFSTLIMGVFYAILSMVAAGVLPVEQVAGQPLSVVAESFLGGKNGLMYIYFVVGGALFALATTLNSTLGWVTKPLIFAAKDGWFPKSLRDISPKFNTPIKLLTLFYLIGLVPIVFKADLGDLSTAVLILYYGTVLITSITVYKMPKVMPDLWPKSKFKVSKGMLVLFALLASASCVLQIYVLFGMLADVYKYIILGMRVAAFVIPFILIKTRKIEIDTTYESI